MIWLRDILYLIGAVLSLPVWGWRLVRTGKWRTDWAGRFGNTDVRHDGRKTLLIHAVSVGEVNAIRALITQLTETFGDELRIVVCATTDTGIARARELFGERHAVTRYPLDFSWCVRRFLNRVQPSAVVLLELEVWPTFVSFCHRRAIPVAVINGRLSERSHRRYRLIRPLIRPTFAKLAAAGVQDETYARRFVDIGVPHDRVTVTGSMKWDTALIRDNVSGAAELAAAMGIDRRWPVVVAGSTGPGEEALIVSALADSDAQLLIAPRKPERFHEAATAMCEPVRRSAHPDAGPTAQPGSRRFLLDTLGELGKAYALADVVIIGRSFVDMGGSDMIEPIALGRATVVGPHVENFASIAQLFLEADAMVQVSDSASLRAGLERLLGNAEARRAMGERGRQVVRAQQGATGRHVQLIASLLRQMDTL